jgi:hypothetical protein
VKVVFGRGVPVAGADVGVGGGVNVRWGEGEGDSVALGV